MNKTALSKLTKPKKNRPVKFTKVDKLLNKPGQITIEEMDSLTDDEKTYFNQVLTQMNRTLKGVDLEKFLHKIDLIMIPETKKQIWEYNHNKITCAIHSLLQSLGRMPSNTEIATETELSRQTIHKHVKEYNTHPLQIEQREQFKMMAESVLAKVFQYAIQGDMNAAKLFFKVVGGVGLSAPATIQNQQNNFIQINGMTISQERIKLLNTRQLKAIEKIIVTTPELQAQ